MKLVIVESPAKCSKIKGYLGDGYEVVATMGHIRSLEPKLTSVGIESNWEPTYEELAAKRDAIAKLKKAAKGASVILATDDDREGEGIAWHVCFLLKLNPATTPRIVFHEITKPAITAAVAAPRLLDMNKVNAQQARSMLDLLIGFTISKVLWNRVAPRLSAGRCQTPALRLVLERDREVESHTATASWRLNGIYQHPTLPSQTLNADGPEVKDAPAAQEILKATYKNPNATIKSVVQTTSISQPSKPLITSTLQQEASSLYGLGPKVTMQAAQKLYEQGHITYMRTDNPQLSVEAATAIREYVTVTYGAEYVGTEGQHTISATPAPEPKKKTKKAKEAEAPATPAAQAAHEAIRPTHPEDPSPMIADEIQRKVYALIWRRATQCQMAPSQTHVRKFQLTNDANPDIVWHADQSRLHFAGYKILEPKDPERVAADEVAWTAWGPIAASTKLKWQTLAANEHFTKPKGRYTEASLVAELEKRGIGRPSTFATLISTILERNYVEKTNTEGKTQDSHHLTISPNVWPPKERIEHHKVGAEKNKLMSTPLGRSVSDFLATEYSDVFNYEFTAAMEQDLDLVAQGTKPWKQILQTTWDTYKDRYIEMSKGGTAATKANRERELAPGLKVILCSKGPLFVRDPPAGSPKSVKATFAALLPNTHFDTVTAEDADAAFTVAAETKAGELLGTEDGEEIRKRRGPYGWYAAWKGVNIPLKGDEPFDKIVDRLKAKFTFKAGSDLSGAPVAAFERKVGDFTIKRGPYGLYMYKHTLKKVRFVKFPPTANADTANATEVAALYSAGCARKPRAPRKTDT